MPLKKRMVVACYELHHWDAVLNAARLRVGDSCEAMIDRFRFVFFQSRQGWIRDGGF